MRSCSDSDVDPLSLTIVTDLELRIGLFLAKKLATFLIALSGLVISRMLWAILLKRGKKLLIIPKLTGSVTLK